MTPKERFIKTLQKKIPDRVPIFDFLFSRKLYKEILGLEIEEDSDYHRLLLSQALGLDGILVNQDGPLKNCNKNQTDNKYTDEWGTIWKRTERSWPHGAPVVPVIKEPEDLINLKRPDGKDLRRFKSAITTIDKNNGELAVIASVPGPFSLAMLFLGLNKLSEYIYFLPDLINEILKIAKDYDLELINSFKKIGGVDAILLSDDLGFSTGTIVNPEWYRENIFPLYGDIVHQIKEYNMFALLHSCGNINSITTDIVNIGFDMLNPLQKTADMDLKRVRSEVGNKIVLSGNISASGVLAFGEPEQVKNEVIECILSGGKNGCYVLSSDHSLNEQMPTKNILAMIDTCKEYGKYPININSSLA